MTAAPIRHVDANARDFRTSLKEAVIEAVLRRSHDRLTGRGELGRIVTNDPATKAFAAGFLLPAMRKARSEEGESVETDITSPIHIATAGMSFQVASDVPGMIEVKPRGSIYVRVLPNAADLAKTGLTFGLRKEHRSELRKLKNGLIKKKLEEVGLGHQSEVEEERKRIAEIKVKAQQEAFAELARGARLPRELVENGKQDALPSVDPVAAAAANATPGAPVDAEAVATLVDLGDAGLLATEQGPGANEDRSTVVWTVRPGEGGTLPDERLVDAAEFPQKWLRLDVDWPALSFDPEWSAERLREACLHHADTMQQALNRKLDAWLQAEDLPGEPGGRRWALPRATDKEQTHKVTPSQVAAWDTHLENLRASRKISAVPTLKLRVEIRVSDDPLDGRRRTVRILLSNRSAVVDASRVPDKLLDRTLYLAGLTATIPPRMHRNHVLGRVRPSYRWNEWLEHAGLGINSGLEAEVLPGAETVLRTTQMPQWRQPRIAPYDINPGPSFEALAAPDGGIAVARALVREYDAWIDATVAAERWKITSEGFADSDEGREKRAFEGDLRCWRNELDRIRRGLSILEECVAAVAAGRSTDDPSVAPLRAWRATNAAFLRVQRDAERLGKFAPRSWRLFQFAFLLSHLPGVVSRIPAWSNRAELFSDSMEADDATASLLYFPTGGGKSEAFFGLLVLQAFVDRLRGKARGVSGFVRYPLRLLTTQQANRFARVLAMAELERRFQGITGDPFQIGFWVGGGNTPNYPSSRDGFDDLPVWSSGTLDIGFEHRQRRDDPKYQAVGKWRRLTDCPFCGSTDSIGLRRREEGNDKRLAHVCLSSVCAWNLLHGGPEPLPFHVMDTDIYAYAPTVLLGTVDKMAAIAQNPNTIARVFGMFGFAPWMVRHLDRDGRPLPGHGRMDHPRKPRTEPGKNPGTGWTDPSRAGCVPIGPIYGNVSIELFDPFPAIEVQDEAHLLEQSLGTFSGLFGSMLETAFAELAPLLGPALTSRLPDGTPRRAKVVAASATVQGPERQIGMLYQRQVRMFPHPGADLYESFFARLAEPDAVDVGRADIGHPEVRTPTRRIYVSMPTNGRPHTSATVAVLSALHVTLTEAYGGMTSSSEHDRTRVRSVLSGVLPPDELRDIHLAAIAEASDDQLAEAIDLARIVLCYVTNKKGGDSVQAALSEFVPRDHERAGVDMGVAGGIDTGLITGSVEIDAIQSIVEKSKASWKVGAPVVLEDDFLGALRGIVATSAISHGVDIERLNMMVFAGLPSDIAEYVQASSRVGRTHVGASILVPVPQRVRDVHVVGIHDVFHRFLERMVQPAAIDRWGENAIDRVIASAVQVTVCACDHFRNLCEANDAARDRLWDSSGVNRVHRRLVSGRVETTKRMKEFLARAIGMEDATRERYDRTKLCFGPVEKDWYENLLDRKIRAIFDEMARDTYATSSLKTFWVDTGRPSPMTSLRDVDEAGVLSAAQKSVIDNRPMPTNLGNLMRRLRRGNGAWAEGEGDRETASEGSA